MNRTSPSREHSVRQALQRFMYWASCDGGSVVISCSGGVDSIVLAHATIREVQDRSDHGFWKVGAPRIVLWHLCHGIRNDDPDDAAFVAEQAESWGVEAIVESEDVVSRRVAGSDSIESVARRIRYDRLERFIHSTGKCLGFTAHHADDNAETILFNLVRGTGPAGLRGISPAYRSFIYRPLLSVASADIAQYAADNSLHWREDPSNEDTKFSRNLIRHKVMPYLLTINSSAVEHINRLAIYGEELLHPFWYDEYRFRTMSEICRNLPLLQHPRTTFGCVEFDPQKFRNLTSVGRVLDLVGIKAGHQLISDLHWSITQTEETLHSGTWHFHFPLPGSGCMYFESDELIQTDEQAPIRHFDLAAVSLTEDSRKRIVELSAQTSERINSMDDPRINNWWEWLFINDDREENIFGDWLAVLPAGQGREYRFRTRRDGDRITLPNGATRKVGDVFTDLKIPEQLRDCWALLVDAQDAVVWIPAIADSRQMHEISASGEYVLASLRPLE